MIRAVLVAMLLAPLAAAEGPRIESRAYVGGPGDLTVLCDPTGAGFGVGGACFAVGADEAHAGLFIADLSGASVGALVRVKDAAATTILETTFCRSASIALPAGGVTLTVFLDEAFGPLDCGVNPYTGTTGIATTGSVTAYFW